METVFVSSTYQDLREYRESVRVAIQRLNMRDISMETYVAEHERPLEKCLAEVRESDLYIGVFAWRYGYVPDGHDTSITELEYREAISAGKNVLIFLTSEDAPWPRNQMDRGQAGDQIEALRLHLTQNHTCAYFSSPHELGSQVTAAVANWSSSGQPIDSAGPIGADTLLAYYQRLQQHYSRLDLDALTPPKREEYLQIKLTSVFVPQSVRANTPPIELPKDLLEKLFNQGEISAADLPEWLPIGVVREAKSQYHASLPLPFLNVLNDPDQWRWVLLGDPGAGKSTLARFVTLALSGPAPDERISNLAGRVPLLVELKSYIGLHEEGKCETFLDFIDYLSKTDGLGIPQEFLAQFLEAGGPALFIFDGLDEIFDTEKRERATRQIVGISERYSNVRVLVTSRIIGYKKAVLDAAEFLHYTLQDLNDTQAEEFLKCWYGLALFDRPEDAGLRTSRLLEAIRQSRSIRELAGNPLLLTILAIIGKHQALSRDRWKLYEHAAAVLVEHWDVNRHLDNRRINPGYVDEHDKKELLRRLALRMQGADGGLLGNYIPYLDLRTSFEEYLSEIYPGTPVRTIASAMIDQFRERNFILSRYGIELYGFVHRAFLEYFCADAIVTSFQRTQKMSMSDLEKIACERWKDPAWREVLRLINGAIDERFATILITRLATVSWQWAPGRSPEAEWNLSLAVQCLGELRNITSAATAAGIVLRRIILLLERCIWTSESGVTTFLRDELIPAVRYIGPAWPGVEVYRAWFQARGAFLTWSPITDFSAQIAALILPVDQVLALFTSTLNRASDPRTKNAKIAGYRVILHERDIALEAVVNIISTETDAAVVDLAIKSLASRHNRSPSEVDRILEGLAINDGQGSAAAIETLFDRESSRAAATEVAIDMISKFTGSWNLRLTTYMAMLVAYGHTQPRVMSVLEDFLNDKAEFSQTLERGIRYALKELNQPVDRFIQHPSPRIRAANAALSARGRDQRTTYRVLRAAAEDESSEVRLSALRSLSGWNISPSNLKLFANDADPVVQSTYQKMRDRFLKDRALASDAQPDGIEDIEEFSVSQEGELNNAEADEPTPYHSEFAELAWELPASNEDEEGFLDQGIEVPGKRRKLVRSRPISDATAIKFVAAEDPVPDVRREALNWLVSNVFGTETVEFLLERLSLDGDDRIRFALTLAISENLEEGSPVRDRLAEICQLDDSPFVRQAHVMTLLVDDTLNVSDLPPLKEDEGLFYNEIPTLSEINSTWEFEGVLSGFSPSPRFPDDQDADYYV